MMNDSIKKAYDQIHAEESLKESTRNFLKEKREQHRFGIFQFGWNVRSFRIAAVCMLFLLFILSGGTFIYITPVTSISIDVNPSIEIGVNMFNRVISLKGYNDDGTQLISALNIKNMNSIEAVESIMTNQEFQKYLQEDSYLAVTVAGKDSDRTKQLLDGIQSSSACHGQNVHCYMTDYGEAESAHEAGFSLGKYRAYLELQKLDPTAKPEDVQNMTMRQIYDRMEELSGVSTGRHEMEDGRGKGNGMQHHGTQYHGAQHRSIPHQ